MPDLPGGEHSGHMSAVPSAAPVDRKAVVAELRHRSSGTRWTHERLLFHMVLGFLIVRTLLGRGMPFPASWTPTFRGS